MSLLPSPVEAAQELLSRRIARRRLLNFTEYTYPSYRAEAAHALIAGHLDRVVNGETTRLMIFAPPQHGKSELASVRLPAFWLGRRPDDPVILSSYAAAPAESKSRQARQIVESDDYATLFPDTATQQDSRAVNLWQIAGRRGSMIAAGVGGPITGHGALLGIIDDPFENWEQAQSAVMREKVWEWYRTTFRTRIWEGGAIVLVMTRWHEDDLAGRILAEQAEDWVVVRLPAVAETQEVRDRRSVDMGLAIGLPDPLGRDAGEPLCPLRFSLAELQRLQRDVGSTAWNAEYQGSPTAPEGNRFKRHWFEIVNAVAVEADRVRYWDKAGTEDGGMFTAGALIARTSPGLYFVEDVVRGQWSALEREQIIKQTAEFDAHRYANRVQIWVEQEPGSGGKESAQATVRMLAGYPVHAETVSGDKAVRAEPLRAQCEAHNVKLIRGPWNHAYLEELASFPNGKYKDQVDASSGAFNKLALARPKREARSYPG